MTAAQISVNGLTKTYRVPEREAGLSASIKSLFAPTYREVPAVREVGFEIAPGEVVGLLGPNGAGKTTVLKMLSGLLHPTAGQAQIGGHVPWQRQAEFLRTISMVLGNKSQMIWDIPALDTFRVLGEVYHVPPVELQRRMDELVSILEMQDLLTRPVRNLSLGERMKCELVAGLLHRPAVLFLDEPTLGLDVSMQVRLRSFVSEYNHRYGATVILTSHYMADVVALCPRVILIHQGRCLYDGALAELAKTLAPYKVIRVTLPDGELFRAAQELPAGVHLLEQVDQQLSLRVGREAAPAVTSDLLDRFPITDLVVEDPPIEAVIDRIYQDGEV